MPKIPLVALRATRYAGKPVPAGTRFEATGHSDARVLIAIGHADFAPATDDDEPVAVPVQALAPAPIAAAAPAVAAPVAEPVEPPAAPVPDTCDPQPEAELEAKAQASEPEQAAQPEAAAKPRRTYRRRDMTADPAGTEPFGS